MKPLHMLLAGLLGALALLAQRDAAAEPYLAVDQGLKCVACHVNPSGGGLRNGIGVLFAQRSMAAFQPAAAAAWTGRVNEWIRIGSDVRGGFTRSKVPGQAHQSTSDLEQWRVYLDVELVPDRLGIYLDESLAPGDAQHQELYLRWSAPGMAWYAKAGRFYLPFGWRLQDNAAFVRSVSGIGMATPDKGIELGLENGPWSAQLAYTRGPGNRAFDDGHQLTGQLIWTQPWGRIGAATTAISSPQGDRRVVGVFGGLRTGPLAWLSEVSLASDEGFPEGRRRLLATLGEVNWKIAQGHNLKLTGEFFDPDRRIREDHKLRQSLVYEFTPLGNVQLRTGWRRWRGIPQAPFDNRQQGFIELHAFM